MSYSTALREQADRLALSMRAIVSVAKKEGGRGLTSEERSRFSAMEADHTALEDSIQIAERSETIAAKHARTSGIGGAVRINQSHIAELRDTYRLSPAEQRGRQNEHSAHAQAFSAYLRQGERLGEKHLKELKDANNGMSLDVRNTMSTTTGTQGGYLIPTGFSEMLEVAQKWFGGIDGVVGKFTTGTGNEIQWPTVNDTTNRGRLINQNSQAQETDLTLNQVTFNAYIGSSDIVLIPLALVEDSYFDLDALVAELLGIRLGRLKNYYSTVGTGVSQPMGIATAANAVGNVYQLPTGETTAIAYNDLVEIEHSVDPAYRPSARWMFNDAILKLLKKLPDGMGRPLWQPGFTSSFQVGAGVDPSTVKPMILGYPYYINQDLPVPAASAYTILFGQMSNFKVREVAGGTSVMVLRERYADFLAMGFLAYTRWDSQYVNAGGKSLALGQQSAS